MTCLSCKTGDMESSITSYFVELEKCMIIIKNVPCLKCVQCGDTFFSATIAEQIEDITSKAEQIASELMIIDFQNKVA